MRRFLSKRRFHLAAVCAASVAVTLVVLPSAVAAPPTAEHFQRSWSFTLDAGFLCDFPIVWDGTQEWTTRTFYEPDGATVAMTISEGTEQDTFSANGKTLVGDEYHFMFQDLYENGERVALYANGNAERVPLPSGAVFITTGRVLVGSTPANIFFVDSGNDANNIAAFCAALS
jgi:hypothetical protein